MQAEVIMRDVNEHKDLRCKCQTQSQCRQQSSNNYFSYVNVGDDEIKDGGGGVEAFKDSWYYHD